MPELFLQFEVEDPQREQQDSDGKTLSHFSHPESHASSYSAVPAAQESEQYIIILKQSYLEHDSITTSHA